MFQKIAIWVLLILVVSGCASTGGVEQAVAAAEAAAEQSASAQSSAEAARAAAHRAAQAAANAQSTANQAMAALVEERPQSVEVLVPQSACALQDRSNYCVWFGTNRKLVRAEGAASGFSNERDSVLHYGRANVRVPKSHKFGETGSSWIKRKLTGVDDRVAIINIDLLGKNEFVTAVGQELRSFEQGKRSAFVYIHGYNTDFEEAVIRAAQIGFDLKIEGVTAVFSWPSAGSIFAYSADEAVVGASESQLEEFLKSILAHPEVDAVNILAHSMGNRALLRVVQNLAVDQPAQPKPINQIILAAPDVDVDIFKQLAKEYPRIANRTTMYVSAEDKLLGLSGIIHNYQRAGIGPPVTVVDGIDTVAVEEVDLSTLGHSYLAEAEAVLNDMFDILSTNTSPDKRIRLRWAMNFEKKRYWFFH